MLKNHCQPYGDQGVLCHATSPHGLIPPIKRSRVPGHGAFEILAEAKIRRFFEERESAGPSAFRFCAPCLVIS